MPVPVQWASWGSREPPGLSGKGRPLPTSSGLGPDTTLTADALGQAQDRSASSGPGDGGQGVDSPTEVHASQKVAAPRWDGDADSRKSR